MSDFLNNIIAQPEGKTLELTRDSASPTLLMKTLVAFANTAGGRLVIGISDDRQIVGVKAPIDEEERLRSLIADSISPKLVPTIEFVTIDSTTLLVIDVLVSALRPHRLKAEGHEEGVYIRIGASNRSANTALIAELGRSAEGISFDEMPMPELGKDDLDLVGIQKCFAGDWKLDEQALLNLKLLTSCQRRLVPTKGAILLFGKERTLHFADAWIQCCRFAGIDKAVIFDHSDVHDHLPLAIENAMLFLKKHATQSSTIPITILREAIINALLHTDYSQRGTPIRISFFDNRIDIENPGIPLPGMTLETMRKGISRIRNHVIARVFQELHLIEQWGSGIGTIFKEAATLGLPEPEITEIDMRIRLTVYLSTTISTFTKKAQVRAQAKKEHKRQAATKKKAQAQAQERAPVDMDILAVCAAVPLSSAEIAAALGHKQLSGNLRKALPRLRDSGLLAYTIPEKPNSRSQKYHLTRKGKALLSGIG